MTKLNLLKGADSIRAAFPTITSTKASYVAIVQQVSCSIVAHAGSEGNGDVSLIPELLALVGRDREAVWNHIRAFAPVYFDAKANTVKVKKGWSKDQFKAEAMAEVCWDTFKPEKQAKVTEVSAAAFLVAEKARLLKIASGQASSESRVYTDAAKKAAGDMLEKLSSMFGAAELVVAGERAAKRLSK